MFCYSSAFRKILFFILPVAICYPLSSYSQTATIDSLLNVLKIQANDTTRVNTLHALTRAYLFELNDIPSIGTYSEQQLQLATQLNYKKGIAWAYLNRGIYYRGISDYTTALAQDSLALNLMIETGDKRGESSCYNNLGLDYYNTGDIVKTLSSYKKGLAIKREIKDSRGVSIICNNIGNLYTVIGDYSNGLTFHLESLKVAEELKDELGMTRSYINIGNIFSAQKQSDKAIEFYQKAEKLSERKNDLNNLALAYNNIGETYIDKKDNKKSLVYLLKALDVHNQLTDKVNLALTLSNIGLTYLALNKPDTAIYYAKQALKLQEESENKTILHNIYDLLGKAYRYKGNLANAENYYFKMAAISQTVASKSGQVGAYNGLSAIYKQQRLFEKALYYTKLKDSLQDSLLNADNFKQINELNIRYDVDKKEKEILLLTKDQELKSRLIHEQQMIRWGLLAGIGMLSISIFSIYQKTKFKEKANTLLVL